jgi:hypothetical protein
MFPKSQNPVFCLSFDLTDELDYIDPVWLVPDTCVCPSNLFLIVVQGWCQGIGTGKLSFPLISQPLLLKWEWEKDREENEMLTLCKINVVLWNQPLHI